MTYPAPTDRIEGNALRILGAIQEAWEERQSIGYRELMELTGTHMPQAIAFHLKRLRRLGLIDWEDGKRRTLRPTYRLITADQLEGEPNG